MDKVQDESQITRKKLSFEEHPRNADSLAEEGKAPAPGDSEKASSSTWDNQAPCDQRNKAPDAAAAKPQAPKKKKHRPRFKTVKASKAQMMRYKAISLAVAVSLIVAIWSLLLLSPLCYFEVGICKNRMENTTIPVTDFRIENCSTTYQGELCTSVCPSSLVSMVHTNITTSLQMLFSVLNIASESCKSEEAALNEFFCQYVYLPCNGDQPMLPSRALCQRLRDESCAYEWGLVSGDADYSSLLPDCELLPEDPQKPECSASVTMATEATDNDVDGSSDGLTSSGDTDLCTATYLGSACQPYINLCPDSTVVVNSPSEDLVDVLDMLSTYYGLVAKGECLAQKDVVIEFLCRYTFQPCDDARNVFLPSRDTCEWIQDEICPDEVQQLSSSNPLLVPNCSLLPDEPMMMPSCEASVDDSNLVDSNSTLVYICNEKEGFYLQNGTCQPRCSEWTTSDPTTSTLVDAIVLLSTIVGAIGGISVIFFSVLRRERVFTFPSVFIIYLTIDLNILGIFVLIQYMDRRGLSCSPDDNLPATLENPTAFCTLSGFVVFYCLSAVSYWWFAHISCTFWKVMWPFHARRHQDKQRYIHICLIVLGILVPSVPPIIVLLVDGYNITKFPPILCIADNSAVAFCSLVLPICFLAGLGITFLIIILYTLQQKSGVFQHRESAGFLNLSAAEKKLLLIFFYYVVLVTIDISLFSVSIANIEEIEDAITQNFLCEAVRTNLSEECPKEYKEIRISETLYIITYLLLGLFSTVNLLFAVNIHEIKVKLKGCLRGWGEFRSRTVSTGVPTPDVPFSLQQGSTPKSFSKGGLSSAALIRENGSIGHDGTYTHKTSSASLTLSGYENSIFQTETEAEIPA